MKVRDRHIVELLLKRRQSEARVLAAGQANNWNTNRLNERGGTADSSRWWIQLAQILAANGKNFITETAVAVADISVEADSYEALTVTSKQFLDYLGTEFERRYRANRFFYSPEDHVTVPLPEHWVIAREGLELDLQIEGRLFDPPIGEVERSDGQTVNAPVVWNATEIDPDIGKFVEVTIAKAHAVSACKRWLAEQYASDVPGLPTKSKAREAAKLKWPGDITARAFNGAWSEVAKDRPWMARPGRDKTG